MEKISRQPQFMGHDMGFRRHAGVRSFRLPPPIGKYLLFFRIHKRHVEFSALFTAHSICPGSSAPGKMKPGKLWRLHPSAHGRR